MSDEFRDYKVNSTPDTLIRLLRAHQDRVYRLCFQVLRRPHDAEDAAQEALIRIASGARELDDPESFRRWVHRVSLNSALEVARKASRRRAHESRAAMKEPPQPIDEEVRRALFEGIAKLDDHARGLLLDHYFEGETLESLASRDGVSAQAVSKRLDRARDDLRRALPASLAGAFDLNRLFDRGVAPPLVPDLVSGPVLAAAAGGAVMTAKSILVPVAVAGVLVLCLGAGVAALSFPWPQVSRRPSVGTPQTIVGEPMGPTAAVDDFALPNLAATEPGHEELRASATSLQVRLDRLKKWWVSMQGERSAVAKNEYETYEAFRKRWGKESWEYVSGLRELIVEKPDVFINFLRDPRNETVIGDLTRLSLLNQTDRPMVYLSGLSFPEYPSALTRGLLELLQSGSVSQRSASLNLLRLFHDVPDEYKNQFLTLLDESDERLQIHGINLVERLIPMTPELFSKLTTLGSHSESLHVRLTALSSISSMKGPEGETFVLNRLAAATHEDEQHSIAFILDIGYRTARREGRTILEDELSKALVEAIARNPHSRLHRLMPLGVHLSTDRLKPVLHQAMLKTEDGGYRDRLAVAVARIEQGSCSTDDVMKLLDPSYQADR